MSPEDRFRLLAGLSLVDARLQPQEEQVLLRAAQGLGLSTDHATGIVRDLMSGGKVSSLAAPADPEARAQLFREMVELVVADGQVSPHELSCLQRLAPSFGVEADQVPEVLQAALQGELPAAGAAVAGSAVGGGRGGGGGVSLQPPAKPRGQRERAKKERLSSGESGCPSCGAPIEFKNARSVAAVCEYCDTTVTREGEGASAALRDLGKISHVVDSGSPIQIDASGTCFGVGFRVIGLLQVEHPTGHWNEWYLEWADRRVGWLGEALGHYYMTFPNSDDPERQKELGMHEVPSFDELKVGARLSLDKKRYTVAEVRVARATGTQGETPFVVTEGYEVPYADLRRTDNGFATIDYSEDPPLVFVGRCVSWKDLNMRGYRRFDGWRA